MQKPSFVKSVEVWQVKNPKTDPKVKGDRVSVTKIAVRDRNGRFHGATNFKTR